MRYSTRRTFLSVLGGLTASTAGCITNNAESERSSPTQFDPSELTPIIESPVPQIPRPIPLAPTDQAIETRDDTVTAIVSQIPDEIRETDIPNGVVRREISHRKSSAVSEKEAALAESSNFRTLRRLNDAQGLARDAKAIYALAMGTVSPTEIETEQANIKRAINQLLPVLRYVGDSLHQTILLYYWLESDLMTARNSLHYNFRKRRSNPIRNGEIGNAIGYAKGTMKATDQLESRQIQETTGDTTKFPTLYRACSKTVESLREFDKLRTETPEELVTIDITNTPAEDILQTAHGGYRNIMQSLNDNLDEGTVADGIHRGVAAFTRFEAYTTLLDQVNNGEYQELTSVDPVVETRAEIQHYLNNPPFSTESLSVITDHFAELATWIASVDDTINRFAEGGHPNRIEREYAQYVHLAHRLEALSKAEQAYNSWLNDP